MREKLKNIFKYDLENLVLQNMAFVILLIIGVLWILYGIDIIEIEYGLTGTGAIIAFWYGYKKYERDKEIIFLNDFNKRNDLLIKETTY